MTLEIKESLETTRGAFIWEKQLNLGKNKKVYSTLTYTIIPIFLTSFLQ